MVVPFCVGMNYMDSEPLDVASDIKNLRALAA
jgi:hypothetical protein